MRKSTPFFILALVMLRGVHAQAVKDPAEPVAVQVSSRLRLIASLEQSTVRIGDPIILHYRLKNVSTGVIGPLFYNGFNDDYWLMVTGASGEEVPRTKEGDRLRQPIAVSMAAITLHLNPGAEDGDRVIDVSKLYRLDRPGNYFVRIARRIGVPPEIPEPKTPQEGAKAPLEEAVSDLIPFTILP